MVSVFFLSLLDTQQEWEDRGSPGIWSPLEFVFDFSQRPLYLTFPWIFYCASAYCCLPIPFPAPIFLFNTEFLFQRKLFDSGIMVPEQHKEWPKATWKLLFFSIEKYLISLRWQPPWRRQQQKMSMLTFENQQKTYRFAWNTSRITELKEETEVKKKQLPNLEDAC